MAPECGLRNILENKRNNSGANGDSEAEKNSRGGQTREVEPKQANNNRQGAGMLYERGGLTGNSRGR